MPDEPCELGNGRFVVETVDVTDLGDQPRRPDRAESRNRADDPPIQGQGFQFACNGLVDVLELTLECLDRGHRCTEYQRYRLMHDLVEPIGVTRRPLERSGQRTRVDELTPSLLVEVARELFEWGLDKLLGGELIEESAAGRSEGVAE